jgi:hypothetical protein
VSDTTFSVVPSGERWAVAVDGTQLATAATAHKAFETALEAAEILRRSGTSAEVEPPPVPSEPRSFQPKA